MKTRMLLSLALLVVFVGGCATPLPVVDKPTENASLPFEADNIDKLKNAMKGYYDAYLNKAKDLREKSQIANEVTFYSSIIGLIGGAAESLNTVIAGATGAAAGAVYNDRYRLQVQAANYELAADAMLCMYFASQDLSESGLTNLMIDGNPADIEARNIARDALLRVRDKLYRLQISFELGQPDLSKLAAALKAPPNSNAGMPKTGVDAQALSKNSATVKAQAQLPEYKNKMDACVAKITG